EFKNVFGFTFSINSMGKSLISLAFESLFQSIDNSISLLPAVLEINVILFPSLWILNLPIPFSPKGILPHWFGSSFFFLLSVPTTSHTVSIILLLILNPSSSIVSDLNYPFWKLKSTIQCFAQASYEFFISSNKAMLSFFIRSSPRCDKIRGDIEKFTFIYDCLLLPF